MAILEQPRRRALVLAGVVLLALGGGVLVTRRPSTGAVPEGGLDLVPRVVPAGQRVVVEVLNGSDRRGAARIATRVLRRAGFDVIDFGNAAEAVDSTRILVRRGADGAADGVRRVLGTGTIRREPDADRLLDLTIIVGPDWRPPPGIIP